MGPLDYDAVRNEALGLEQDTHPQPTPEGNIPVYDASDFDDAPLLGEGTAPVRPFRLAVTHATDGPRVEGLRAYAEADAGSLLAMQRARTQMEQAQASAGLILAALVDDDGLSVAYQAPEQDEDRLAAIHERINEIAAAGVDDEATRAEMVQLTVETDEMEPDPRLEDPSRWSSRRRFEAIMNDPDDRVRPDALTKLAELIIGEAAGRPTQKSDSSSRGPRRTRRG